MIWVFILCFGTKNISAQDIDYSPLYNDATFQKTIDTSLPVGSISAEGGVSAGMATYNVPIALPSGTNNVTPSISIGYTSQVSDGLLGIGWNIQGLSAISRTNKSEYFDNEIASIQIENDDALVLDGARLILKSGEHGELSSVYSTEAESFSTISLESGLAFSYFKVVTKEGIIMEYGNTPDSRYKTTGFLSQSPMIWLLNKVIHPDGNYIEYKYKVDDSNKSEGIIDEINYTGNQNAGLSPYNKVKFNYKTRFDQNIQYLSGRAFETKYLLDNITITADNNQSFKSYHFNYGKDEINSYLKEIIEKGTDGTALNSTIVKYGQKNNLLETSPLTLNLSYPYQAMRLISGDYDGDGNSDMLVSDIDSYNGFNYDKAFSILKNGASSPSINNVQLSSEGIPEYQIVGDEKIPHQHSYLVGDYTGDGKDNVLVIETTITDDKLVVGRQRIYSFENNATSYTYSASYIAHSTYKVITNINNYIRTGDFDGDGVIDVLTFLGNTGLDPQNPDINKRRLKCSCSGEITGSGNLFDIEDFDDAKHYNVIDFDGDGKQELLLVGQGAYNTTLLEVLAIENGQLVSLYSSSYGQTAWGNQVFTGDFNGDGKTDFLKRDGTTSGSPWSKVVSTGKTFITEPFTFEDRNPDFQGSEPDKVRILDFNGDGKMDILHGWNILSSASVINIYYSTGKGFYKKAYYHSEKLKDMPFAVFDTDGDGRPELLNRTSIFEDYTILHFNKEKNEHYVEQIINGEGHLTEWVYQKMNDASDETFYQKTVEDDSYIYNLPITLVKEFKTTDGLGDISSISYEYEDYKIDKKGRGILGFTKIKSYDYNSGVKTVVENKFEHDNYNISYPYKTSNYKISNNQLINTSISNYEIEDLGNKRYWLKTLSSSNEDFISRWKTTTSYSNYDNYGNVTTLYTNRYSDGTIVNSSTINTTYEAYGSLIPNKPTVITSTNTRIGQNAYSSTVQNTYNNLGQLTSKTTFHGLPKSTTTSYVYNNLGNQTSVTINPSGLTPRTKTFTFDSKGRFALTSTNALGQTTEPSIFDYRWGKPLSITGINGLTTTFEYDAFGRLVKTTKPEGYEVNETYVWNINNNENTVSYHKTEHPGRPDILVYYDVLGRDVKKVTELYQNQWVTEKKTYDSRGNLKTTTAPYKLGETPFITTNHYDEYNRVISTINPIGTTTFEYAYLGTGANRYLKTTLTNPAGQVSFKKTDATGKTIQATDNGGTLDYTYNSQGKMIRVKNGTTTLIENIYDAYGKQTSLIDKNGGTTNYVYDALGQLESQTGANGDTHSFTYDLLGRKLTRVGEEGTISYEYFTTPGTSLNKVKKIINFNGDTEEFTYDNFGRAKSIKVTIDGEIFITTNQTYSQYGNLLAKKFPSGVIVNYEYSSNGILAKIKDNNGQLLYENNGMNSYAQVTSYTFGNNKTSSREYQYGIPTRYYTEGIEDYRMVWDYQSSNLLQRKDAIYNLTEDFTYDNLNRLTSSTVDGMNSISLTYTANGNINSKSDAGDLYHYDNNKINALVKIDNEVNISQNDQDIVYSSYLQPERITEGDYELVYRDGSNLQRRKAVLKQSGIGIDVKYYLGDYERQETNQGTNHIHYVGNGVIIISNTQGSTVGDAYYSYTDHLGSILKVTDSNGTIVANQNFDAWGRFRNPNNWTYVGVPSTNPSWLYRGYTGHEQLKEFALINMNGRLYDPVVGRMLSVDNNIQLPDYTQNYNRYSYALNNPLKYTDPDGEFIVNAILGAFIGIASNGIQNVLYNKPFFKGAGKAALFGGLSGAVSGGIGNLFPSPQKMTFGLKIGKAIAHGIGSAAISMISGDNSPTAFITGAIASGFSSVAAHYELNPGTQIIYGGVGGGLAAKIAGGDLVKGITKGVIIGGLNHAMHDPLVVGRFAIAAITGRIRHLGGADAKYVSLGGSIIADGGATGEIQGIRILRGDDAGKFVPFTEGRFAVGLDVSGGIGVGEYYYAGPKDYFSVETLKGMSFGVGGSIGTLLMGGLGIDGGVSVSASPDVHGFRTYGISAGLSWSPLPGRFSWQTGVGYSLKLGDKIL